MKTVILSLMTGALWAQQTDIINQSKNAYIDLARNAVWSRSGPGGMFNSFLFFPVSPNATVCIWINNNNPTSGHTFTLRFATTTDQTIRTFNRQMDRWVISPDVNGPVTIGPRGTFQTAIALHGAAVASINFDGSTAQSGTPDTGDLLIAQTAGTETGTNPPCAARNLLNNSASDPNRWQTANGYIQPFACTQTVNISGQGIYPEASLLMHAYGAVKICNIYLTFERETDFGLFWGDGCNYFTPTFTAIGNFTKVHSVSLDLGPQAAITAPLGDAWLCVYLNGDQPVIRSGLIQMEALPLTPQQSQQYRPAPAKPKPETKEKQ